jgi:hypothetical protein
MMLTPIPAERLPDMIGVYDAALAGTPVVQAAFRRIIASKGVNTGAETLHRAAVDLARRVGMQVLDAAPADGFSWDGHRVAVRTEPSVLIHEIAHWLIANESRRALPDFGLGSGPETGFSSVADSARCVDDATKEGEENLASLLGILWEVNLGGPAIDAFCEQNWFELYDRSGTHVHFVKTLEDLRSRGLVDRLFEPVVPSQPR